MQIQFTQTDTIFKLSDLDLALQVIVPYALKEKMFELSNYSMRLLENYIDAFDTC